MDGPSVAGELVVQNGKRRGTRVALTVPVTLIGAAERCDVRVQGPAVADVHCLISITPAGPALRSWQPDATRVNGELTAAGLLHDGDVLQVGPCLFRFVWHSEELIALHVAPPEASIAVVAGPIVRDELWDLQEREAALHRHETELANLLDHRQHMLADMMCELATHREELRRKKARDYDGISADRAEARKLRDHAERFRKDARQRRTKVKAVHSRFLLRMKSKWSAERRAVESERTELERTRSQFTRDAERATAERERFTAEAQAYQKRLTDAWTLLAEGQRRLLADRQEAERAHAIQREQLDKQLAEVAVHATTLEAGRQKWEARVQELIAEAARLDVRATQARAIVQQLEDRRGVLETDTAYGSPTSVPLDRAIVIVHEKQDASELLTDLAHKERDLTRERGGLIQARAALERGAADLYDQRCVLAEQVAALVVAREAWQVEEYRTITELEGLARGVDHREKSLDARDREIETRDRNSRLRDENLREYRRNLDQWQLDLSEREHAMQAAGAELSAKQDHLARWEESLGDVAREWADAHQSEVERLRIELDAAATTRASFATKEKELDRDRLEVLASARRLAALDLTAVQARGDSGPLAERRLRVLQKQWERHFLRLSQDLTKRRTALDGATALAETRQRELARELVRLHERRAAEVEKDRLRLLAERSPEPEPVDDMEPVILSLAGGRVGRPVGSDLVALRAA